LTKAYGRKPTCHPDRKHEANGLCKPCYNNRLYREKPHIWHSSAIKRKFGIAPEVYAALLLAQGGVCAICGGVDDERRLAVDHDHETGAVRGLLCRRCNQAIGAMKDNPDLLRDAAAYIERTRCSPSQN
jgi:hypothetical protein